MQWQQYILRNKISRLFPRRKPDSHKGNYGKALLVAGSPGMIGAAILASRGALRSGAGLTFLALPKELANFVNPVTPEVITIPFEQIDDVKADAIGFGPGLGNNRQTKEMLSHLLSKKIDLIIDADGLNALNIKPEVLKKARAKVVITPHPGEMSRLLKRPIEAIQKNRPSVAKEAAKKFNCIVVLKGHKTVIANPAGNEYVNLTGNPGMASGGVGDVLTGLITGLAAQGIPLWDAAVAGVYLHGLAGDLAAKEKGEYGMTAGDLIDKIPYAIQKSH